MKKDIFISYKNDNAGNNFAYRLKNDLEKCGYSVYFNSDEKHSGDFPEKLREAVEACKDFFLIVSQQCLDQLIEYRKIDWIREELLTAHKAKKNIVPILLTGVSMPADIDEMPEELRFLPKIDNVVMPEKYEVSPFEKVLSILESKPEKDDIYRDTYNSNPCYDVANDLQKTVDEAGRGSVDAMYMAAVMYYYGFADENGEAKRDFEKAHYWIKRILDTEDEAYEEQRALAKSILAEMYYHGTVPRESQSYAKAVMLHREAEKTSGFSAREYAYLSSRGCGCDFDYDATVDHYLKAIDQGDNLAVLGLARLYMEHGKYHSAAELYKKTCAFMPEAEFQLGMLYRNGLLSDPPKPDFFRAAFYFQHAIATGKCGAEVYHELGRLYFTPTGDFPKDFVAAEANFKKAADMGNKGAQYKLALMYQYGYVTRDPEKAIYYHTEAVSNGVSLSAYQLSLIYQQPETRNYHKAFKYAYIAAKKGVMEGEFVLANLLYFGRGCEADENRAYKYYVKAYNHGMVQARFMMEKIEKKTDK